MEPIPGEFLEECGLVVLNGDRDSAFRLAQEAIKNGFDILKVIERGFSKGISKAGDMWESGEYFLPELAFSAEAMKVAMEVLRPALLEGNEEQGTKGKVVIGTVQGDIHDIGKTIVATMLSANGYSVFDLGADVAYERFLEEVVRREAELLCMSALLTTTMVGQEKVIALLKKEGLHDTVKVMIGGAPASEAWAHEIGADAYADNAIGAVKKAHSLLPARQDRGA